MTKTNEFISMVLSAFGTLAGSHTLALGHSPKTSTFQFQLLAVITRSTSHLRIFLRSIIDKD